MHDFVYVFKSTNRSVDQIQAAWLLMPILR